MLGVECVWGVGGLMILCFLVLVELGRGVIGGVVGGELGPGLMGGNCCDDGGGVLCGML